ncbi:MAG: Uma2 family endonuclease [Blastocatellia bacterium]
MTRKEFERRYQTMPRTQKAELIEGIVYMPSPVRFDDHGEPHGWVIGWLAVYSAITPGARLGDNTTVRLDLDNDPQPDALLRIDERLGGGSRISRDGYVEGPPELIIEISASSASIDLHDKLEVYRRNGVREYIVWRTEDGELDWFRLRGKKYSRVRPDKEGMIASSVFPGLRLHVNALLGGDMKKVLAELQKGLNSKEHADFVKRLSQKSARKPKRE